MKLKRILEAKERAERAAPDVVITFHGRIFLFRPGNDAAAEWLRENVEKDAQWWGGALAVEDRYAERLIGLLNEAGFTTKPN